MLQMRKRWDQIGHVTCPTIHKCKSKNKNLSYKQAQQCDLIGLQTHLQSNLKDPLLHLESYNSSSI
jgi:hypothetical protein